FPGNCAVQQLGPAMSAWSRPFGDVGSMSGLLESGGATPAATGDARHRRRNEITGIRQHYSPLRNFERVERVRAKIIVLGATLIKQKSPLLPRGATNLAAMKAWRVAGLL